MKIAEATAFGCPGPPLGHHRYHPSKVIPRITSAFRGGLHERRLSSAVAFASFSTSSADLS